MGNKVSEVVGFDAQVLAVRATQNVTTSGSSAQSTALNLRTRIVRLVCTTDTYVAFGTSPTATTSSMLLPAYTPEYFAVELGGSKVAAIQASSAGVLNIAEMM